MSAAVFSPWAMRLFCALMSLIDSFITSNNLPAAGFFSTKALLATICCLFTTKP